MLSHDIRYLFLRSYYFSSCPTEGCPFETDLFLVDPVVLGLLPALDLALLEPKSDLLLGGLDGIGAVADVTADVLLVGENISASGPCRCK